MTFEDYGIRLPGRASGQVNTQCPECSSHRKKKKAPCLSVNADEGVWLCLHCGWSGSLKKGPDDISNVLHWRKPTYHKPEPLPAVDLSPEVMDWFLNRGISAETLKENNISSKKVYMPQTESLEDSIAFPYYKDGELINVKYRDGKKNFRLEAGAQRIPYGIDDIIVSDEDATSRSGWSVIVEGEIDKLALWEAGIKNCTSVPDGAPPPNSRDYSSKFEYLNGNWTKGIGKFILAVDNDEAGKKLEDELSRRLGREVCYKVDWPEGCKDANEVLIKYGKSILIECIDHAAPYPIEGTYNAIELSDSINRLYDSGMDQGVSTGWSGLNPLYLVRPGALTTVTGIPSSGKSNWIDAMMVNIAKSDGWNFAIFSPENQPMEDHMARVLEKYIGAPFNDGPQLRMSKEELEHGKRWLSKHFTWILPHDDKEWSIETILKAAQSLVLKKGIRGLVIDPWNELEHMRPNNQTETEYISICLKRVRQFARKAGIHIWIVAHPAKLYRDKNGKVPIPTPYDISGSARWRDKSDNCITVWRDLSIDSGAVIEIHTQKVRFRQDGRIGMSELAYNWSTGTYHELNKATEEIPPKFGV